MIYSLVKIENYGFVYNIKEFIYNIILDELGLS